MHDRIELEELATRVHTANERWWKNPATGEPIERNKGEMVMLMVSELSEAMEGARKDLNDDHLPHRKMEEVEIADCMIRLLDYIAGHGYKVVPYLGRRPEFGKNKGEDLLEIVGMLWHVYHSEVTPSQAEYYLGRVYDHLVQYAHQYNHDLWGAFEDKMEYNRTRQDHTNEARLQPGGKKW